VPKFGDGEGTMLNLVVKNLFRRRTRTLLTMLGIAVGVAAIVALGAMAEGIRAGYQSMFSGSGADLVLMQKGAYDITMSAVDEDILAQVAGLPGVREATGLIVGNVQAPGAPYFFVFGYDPDGFSIHRFRVVEGSTLGAARRASPGLREILIGKQAAEALKLKVGDVIRLTGGAFRVAGIYTSGSGFEDAAGVVSLSDAQRLLQKTRQVGAVQVKLSDVRQIDRVRAQLERVYPKLSVSQSSDTANQQQWIAYIQGFALGIALLAVIIGGVGMTNTVMMSTFERTREIGTLRALGWGHRRVLATVFTESVLLGVTGGLIGCAIGAAAIGLLVKVAGVGFLQGKLTPDLLAQGLLTAALLGAAGGAYPAWWASRLMPIEALRYQGGSSGRARSRFVGLKSETFRSLGRRRLRTIMTIVGVSIGLTAVIMLRGMADGFIDTFRNMLSAGDVDIVVRQAGASDLAYSTLSDRVGRQVAALPGVQSVSGMAIAAASTDDMPIFLMLGYSPSEPAIRHFKVVEGRMLSGSHEIMLGRPAAEVLKVRVGEVLRVSGVGFRVVGLYETGVSFEESSGVVSLRDAQAILGRPRQVSLYLVKVNDPQHAEAIRAQIEAGVSGTDPALSSDFAENLPDMRATYVMVDAISGLAILVGGIGMMNTMIMSIYERTREIGTLRALGWRRRRVLALVLKESIALSLIGVIVGAVLAALFSALMRQIPLWGDMLLVVFSPGLFMQALIVALMLGAIGGSYPAWRASQLSPAEALRYE
jgi:ABC-type antimicrobial peptide transport system permease subunit